MTAPHEQKLRITGPVVVTANRVTDGKVVYRASDGRWSTELDDAAIVTKADAARAVLATAEADELNATGVYLAPVAVDDAGNIEPGNLREVIRRSGPTVALPTGMGG